MTAAPSSEIASLLGSRICHDLISPIGAISNGVELLRMSGGPSGPEIDLISESVDNANARIRFFRVAYGAASSEQTISANEVRDILADMGRSNRLQIEWLSTADLPRFQVKLTFLLLQCVEAALPWGGQVSVHAEGEMCRINVSSDRMKLEEGLWQYLQGGEAHPEEVGAAEVQFLLLPLMLQATGRRLAMDRRENELILRM